jgi:GNAT superfamily N-acetyltransferase
VIRIRGALRQDIPELLRLMRALARFEGYAAEFAVTRHDLEERGFGAQPQFFARVAEEEDGTLAGMAVCQVIPYTYDLRPTLVLKELYVDETRRALGIGERLMADVARQALHLGCGRLRWDVLRGNRAAERFYTRLGGRRERRWIAYRMDQSGLEALTQRLPAQATLYRS